MEWEVTRKQVAETVGNEAERATRQERLDWVVRAARAVWGDSWRVQVAKAAGVSSSLVQLWAEGKRYPTGQTVGRVYEAVDVRARLLDVAMKACPRGAPVVLQPAQREEQGADWSAVPGIAEAAAPAAAPAPAARGPGRPRKPPTPEKIAAALEDRGYKIRDRGSYPKWYDAAMRAKDDADRAAGRVVYTDELMQHAGILDE